VMTGIADGCWDWYGCRRIPRRGRVVDLSNIGGLEMSTNQKDQPSASVNKTLGTTPKGCHHNARGAKDKERKRQFL